MYVYAFQQEGDRELYNNFYKTCKAKSNEKLVAAYNHTISLNVAARAQMFYWLAMDKVFHERFDKSPFYKDGIIGHKGPIVYKKNSFILLKKNREGIM